ncbi:kinase-like domain-containing protein, partial [Cantharellus anzutake]|uniref:kinase-like domain-containing protein n=1 Tax=Cantharellus anzutake TaxID=1750568 RepID=UPI001903EC0D
REIDIWSKINHPNIVPFYGYILEVEGRTLTVGFVTSWCRFGNVASYLQSNPQIDEINMIHDLAEGLRYLHSQEPPIIHGNMKPENVLIGSDRRALIADFGIHTILEGFSLGNTSANLGIVGAMRFTAPELVQYSDEWPRRTTASDVWAFGCTAMQVCFPPVLQQPRFEIPPSRFSPANDLSRVRIICKSLIPFCNRDHPMSGISRTSPSECSKNAAILLPIFDSQ